MPSASFRGDFAKLARLINGMQRVSRPEFRRAIVDRFARESVEALGQSFDGERDPYGVQWKRSEAAKREGRKTLQKTHRLRRSLGASNPSARGVTFRATAPYASYHQHGTVRMVKRAILPDERGMPKKLVRSFKRIASEQRRGALGR